MNYNDVNDLFGWAEVLALRHVAMAQVEENAGEVFRVSAKEYVVAYLGRFGPTRGEDITDSCKSAGIIPHDDRAFGPVYFALARAGVIEKAGYCLRRKGHGTTGGNIWQLVDNAATENNI